MKGYLEYVIKNCEFALDELCKINKELNKGMRQDSSADVNRLGALDRMIKDYLIIRVAGLFDKDTRTISFANFFINNLEFDSIKNEDIINNILEVRHKFIAHSDKKYIQQGDFSIETAKLCDSNLKELLSRLKALVD